MVQHTVEIQIDAIMLKEWSGVVTPLPDGSFSVPYRCIMVPIVDGQLVTDGPVLDQLRLLGFRDLNIKRNEFAAGDLPSTAEIGADMLAWIGELHAAAVAEWVEPAGE
jgi:hypothetical protein